jgi:hypothetical protein
MKDKKKGFHVYLAQSDGVNITTMRETYLPHNMTRGEISMILAELKIVESELVMLLKNTPPTIHGREEI